MAEIANYLREASVLSHKFVAKVIGFP